MTTKIDYQSEAPELLHPMYETGKLLAQSGLEPKLQTLVQLRASQINGCAFCLALHRREGHALGDTDDRMFGVAAWREAPWYSERERLALEWTEALTRIPAQRPADDLLPRLHEHFSNREIVYLTHAINAINAWNRLNVAFGTSPEYAQAVFERLRPSHAATAAGSGTN